MEEDFVREYDASLVFDEKLVQLDRQLIVSDILSLLLQLFVYIAKISIHFLDRRIRQDQ